MKSRDLSIFAIVAVFFAALTVSNGFFNILLDSVDTNANPLNPSFSTQYYLGITVGPDSEMVSRQPLAARPCAIRAAAAARADALATGGTAVHVFRDTGTAHA